MKKLVLILAMITLSSFTHSAEIKTWTGTRKSNGGSCQAIYKATRIFKPQLSLNFDLKSNERYETTTAPLLLVQELPETFLLEIIQGTNPTTFNLSAMPFEWTIKANTIGNIRHVEFNGIYYPNRSSTTPYRFIGILKYNQDTDEMDFKKIEQTKVMFGSYKTIFEDECLNMR
jgi:hypothetical protein